MIKMSRLISQENANRSLRVQPVNASTPRQENNSISVSPQAHCSKTISIIESNEEISVCSTASSSFNEKEGAGNEVDIS